MCIAENAYQFAGMAMRVEALRAHYAPFTARVLAAPLLLAVMELVLWVRFYRFDDLAARWAAAWAGGALTLIVLIQFLRASIQIPLHPWLTGLYAYLAISHLLYAGAGGHANQLG